MSFPKKIDTRPLAVDGLSAGSLPIEIAMRSYVAYTVLRDQPQNRPVKLFLPGLAQQMSEDQAVACLLNLYHAGKKLAEVQAHIAKRELGKAYVAAGAMAETLDDPAVKHVYRTWITPIRDLLDSARRALQEHNRTVAVLVRQSG